LFFEHPENEQNYRKNSDLKLSILDKICTLNLCDMLKGMFFWKRYWIWL